jgi:hypothetical protein
MKKCKQPFVLSEIEKVCKFVSFCLLLKYFKMLHNPGKCLSQFILTFLRNLTKKVEFDIRIGGRI